jgi:hypothetical protein
MRQPSDYKFVTTVLGGGIETQVVHIHITNPSSLHAIIKKNTQEIIQRVRTCLNPCLSSEIHCVRLWLPCYFQIYDDYPSTHTYQIFFQ